MFVPFIAKTTCSSKNNATLCNREEIDDGNINYMLLKLTVLYSWAGSQGAAILDDTNC